MKIQDIKEKYYLNEHSTGGGCTALFGELNTLQNHMLITSNNCQAPTDSDDNFIIGIYTENDGAPHCTFETDNVGHLADLVDACYVLWGNA